MLPHVESGVVTLLGATTENPSFEVNAALLSRSRVVRLEALADSAIDQLLDRALVDAERGLGRAIRSRSRTAPAVACCHSSGGDARIALNALELAVHATLDGSGAATVTAADIEGALQNPALLYDRAGDQHYWLISAFIKSMRGSDPDAAVYWMARMLEAGEDPLFVARRMVILAAEDVGLADPQALTVAVAAQQAAHFVGMPEGFLPLTEAALYLATAPKSNSAMTAYTSALADVRETLHQPVPLHLRNAVTGLDRSMGFGSGYRYAHAYEDGIVEQQHLPDSLAGHRYYEPSEQGAEAAVAERLRAIRAELAARDQSKRLKTNVRGTHDFGGLHDRGTSGTPNSRSIPKPLLSLSRHPQCRPATNLARPVPSAPSPAVAGRAAASRGCGLFDSLRSLDCACDTLSFRRGPYFGVAYSPGGVSADESIRAF